jgi:GT2 family glycosyltransferase
LFEPEPGKNHALNRGLEDAALGDLVAFTDDDVLWRAGGLAALSAAAAARPDAGFFGGRVLPWWPEKPPRWLHDPTLDLIAGVLGHYAPDIRSRALQPADPLPFGANFAVRRRVLDAVGAFDTRLGAVGPRRRRGEDTDLLRRARDAGYTGYYAADALCLHRVDARNLALPRLFDLGVEKGLCLDPGAGAVLARRRNQAVLAARGLVQILKGRGDRFRQCVVRMGIEQGLLERRRG